MDDRPRLVRVKPAAVQLDMDEHQLRKLLYAKRIPFVKVGPRAIRLRQADLDKIIEGGLAAVQPRAADR